MRLISETLNPKNKHNVRNLHTVLGTLLGREVACDEVSRKSFDGETETAIREALGLDGDISLLDEKGKLQPEIAKSLNARLMAYRQTAEPEVTELHRRLGVLKEKGLIRSRVCRLERYRKVIGRSTSSVLKDVQVRYGLPVTGEYDAETHARLDSVITGLAAGKPKRIARMGKPGLAKLGRTVGKMRLNMSSEKVAILQRNLAFLGAEISNDEYKSRTFGKTTRDAVLAFQRDNGLTLTGEGDRATANAINSKLARFNPETVEERRYRVRGSVRDESWDGRAGVMVRVSLLRIGEREIPLAERKTFANGFFDILYDPGKVQPPFRLAVDTLDSGGEVETRKLVRNTARVLWVNFTAGPDPYRGPSEFQQISGMVSKGLKGSGLVAGDLEQSERRSNITELGQEIGVRPDAILRLTLAHRLADAAAQPGLDATLFYGFLRQDLPPELPGVLFPDVPEEWDEHVTALLQRVLDGLAMMTPEELADGFDAAMAQNYLPRRLLTQRKRVLEALEQMGTARILERPTLTGDGTLAEAAGRAGLSADEAAMVARSFRQHRVVGDVFFNSLADDEGLVGHNVKALKETLDVGYITNVHTPMLEAIDRLVADPNRRRITRPSGLAKFGAGDWSDLMAKQGIDPPEGTDGGSLKERRHTYAMALAERSQRLQPAIALTAAIGRTPQVLKRFAHLDEVEPFFDRLDDQDVLRTNIAREANGLSDAAFLEAATIQRVARMAPHTEAGLALLGSGMLSAMQVYFRGQEGVINDLGAQGIDKPDAVHVYRVAQHLYSHVLAVVSQYRTDFQSHTPALIPNLTYTVEELDAVRAEIPNLEALFGNVDYCDCRLCNSVYGPAAYLSDVLRFLGEKRANAPFSSAFAAFDYRRPEVAKILLDCANTNTRVPQIDLINELLEGAISPEARAFAHQTTHSPEQLRASPEHQRDEAYRELRTADFPMHISFDAWQSEMRLLLEHLRLPRHEIMEVFRNPAQAANKAEQVPSDVEIAAEYFGLSTHALGLIAPTADAASLSVQTALWGFNPQRLEIPVAEILAAARISYQELVILLMGGFVNSGKKRSEIVSDKPVCDPEAQRVNHLDLDKLDRMHRFLRLWRHTDWSMPDLDLLIQAPALGNGILDRACLSTLYRAARVQKTLKLNGMELHAFFADIDTGLRVSDDHMEPLMNLYEELFQNPTISRSVDSAFELPLNDSKLSAHSDTLTTALAITVEELSLLLPFTDGRLTLRSLTVLFRHTRLAQALSLRVEELVTLLHLSADLAPFGDPTDMLTLIERHESIQRARISIGRLAYGLSCTAESPFGLREAVIAQQLGLLRSELAALEQEFVVAEGPWRDRLNHQLARIDSLANDEARSLALDLIEGRWNGGDAERLTFIKTHFRVFIPAQANPDVELTGDGPGPDVALTPTQEAALMTRVDFVTGHLKSWTTRKQVVRFAGSVTGLADDVSAVLLNRLSLPGQATPLVDTIRAPVLTARDANGEFIHGLTEAELPDPFLSLRLLHKAATVLGSMKVPAADIDWLITHHSDIGGLDFSALPVSDEPSQPLLPAWLVLQTLLSFRETYPDPEATSLFDLLERGADPASDLDLIEDDLALIMQWDATELSQLCQDIGLHHQTGQLNFASPATYARIARCREMIRLSGTDVATHVAWATREGVDDKGVIKEEVRAETARRAVKSKYTPQEWLHRIEPITNRMRELRRDALVGWLIETSRRNQPASVDVDGVPVPNLRRWESPADLSDWFLTDVLMSSRQTTSRIKFATDAVQTFVQRCFRDLEKEFVSVPGKDPDAVNSWSHWRWLENEQLRRAALEIFYHGENWIDPRLRDDKTPFFVELEQELLQKEMTPENVEAAFHGYIEKLDEVADLEIVSLFYDYFGDTETLHVIGRTRSIPHTHYYRSYDLDYGTWSPWEKIDQEIESDNLMVTVYNRRLHLFWLDVERKPQKVKKNPPVKDPEKPSDRTDLPDMLEIALAWSVRQKTGWSGRKQSRLKLIHPWPRPMFSYHLAPRYKTADNSLWIDVFVSTSREFNNTKFYDQYATEWRKLTRASFWETYRPWHSSSFVFDGTVKRVLQRGIEAQYFMADQGKLSPTDSYEYVFNNFGEAGRTIERLTEPDRQLSLRKPHGLHFERNHLANNRLHQPNQTEVRIMTTQGSRLLLGGGQAPFRVALPMQLLDTRSFIYQDQRRSFFVKNDWREIRVNYGSPRIVSNFIFYPFYHPYSKLFLRELDRTGVDGLLRRPLQTHPQNFYPPNHFNFFSDYKPAISHKTDETAVHDRLDFSVGGAYSVYNWEIFYHAPMLIAMRLNEEQRFEDAMRWYRYIFDPMNTEDFPSPQRYWITKPFFEHSSEDYREQRLSDLAGGLKGDAPQIKAWKNDPFKPHLIARYRPVMYQKATCIRFIENLVDWGDTLFRRDTMEDINEATQHYLLASEILGPQPRRLPALHREAKSFADLKTEELDAIGNALIDTVAENQIGLPIHVAPSLGNSETLPPLDLAYFCVPPNEALMRIWDKVAERLWNIRNSRNIEGIERQLALWEPRIDPALLVKAAATGVDIGSVLDDLSVPSPHYRPQALLPIAQEFCSTVQQFGATLLQHLTAADGEALSNMRAKHEASLMRELKDLRDLQLNEAKAARSVLDHTRELSQRRYDEYSGREFMNVYEILGSALSGGAISAHKTGTALEAIASFSYLLPDLQVGGAGIGGSPLATTVITAGDKTGKSLEASGHLAFNIGTILEKGARMLQEVAGYQRRQEEWNLQADLAKKEIRQAEAQMAAADIRITIAKHEKNTAQLQVKQAKAVEEYIKQKFTNRELYQWQLSQLSTVYFEAYKLAFDMAKQVERAVARDLCRTDLNFVQFGYWDSLKKGLTAGDQLMKALMQVKAAYMQENRRRLELTKQVSLANEAPLALQSLITSGECYFDLTETLFDRDHPGHILRCLKSVSLTVTGVTGPYSGVHGELHMLSNRVRVSNIVGTNGYAMTMDDERFRYNLGTLDTMVISHGQSDAGLFQISHDDSRFLWFEGSGAISSWSLRIPQENNAFDIKSISDVVLTLQYYALPGGATMEEEARKHLASLDANAGMILLNARHGFASQWQRFLFPEAGEQKLIIDLKEQHYPHRTHGRTITLTRILLFVDGYHAADFVGDIQIGGDSAETLQVGSDPAYGGMPVQDIALASPSPGNGIGPMTIRLRKDSKGGRVDFDSLPPLQGDDIRDIVLIAQYALS